MSHHPIPHKDKLEDENWNLLELGRPLSEPGVIEPVLYLRFSPRPQVITDEVCIKRTEKVQRPNSPVLHLLIYRAVQRGTAKVKPEEVQATFTEKVTVAAAVSVVYVVEVRSLVTTSF